MRANHYNPIMGLAVILAMLLAGCASSAASIGTAIAETQREAPTLTPSPLATPTLAPSATATATPTATPTLVPLADINLESILIRDGDLPAGYSGAQISHSAPGMFRNLAPAAQVVVQLFGKNGSNAGGVTIFLYDLPRQVQTAYGLIVDGFGQGSVSFDGLGETAQVIELDLTGFYKLTDLAFTRCHAVVEVRMTNGADSVSVGNYAKRLDGRLKPLVCR
jgi:hypothetical protein